MKHNGRITLEDISNDETWCLEQLLEAVKNIRRQTIYYSDNHLRETIYDINRSCDRVLTKIRTKEKG